MRRIHAPAGVRVQEIRGQQGEWHSAAALPSSMNLGYSVFATAEPGNEARKLLTGGGLHFAVPAQLRFRLQKLGEYCASEAAENAAFTGEIRGGSVAKLGEFTDFSDGFRASTVCGERVAACSVRDRARSGSAIAPSWVAGP